MASVSSLAWLVTPWAQVPAEGAGNFLECPLGRYSSNLLTEWRLPVDFDV